MKFAILDKEKIINKINESNILSNEELLFLDINNINIENVLNDEFDFTLFDDELNILFLIKMKIIIFIQNNFKNKVLEFYYTRDKLSELKSTTFEKFLIDLKDGASSNYLFFAYLENKIELSEKEKIDKILKYFFEILNKKYLIISKKSKSIISYVKEFCVNIEEISNFFENKKDFIFFIFLLIKNNFLILKDKQVHITIKFYTLNFNFWSFFKHQNIINLINMFCVLGYEQLRKFRYKYCSLIKNDISKCQENCFLHFIFTHSSYSLINSYFYFISINNFMEKKFKIISLEKFINFHLCKENFWKKQKIFKNNMTHEEIINFFNNFLTVKKSEEFSLYKTRTKIEWGIKNYFPILKEIKYLKYINDYKINFEIFKIESNLDIKEWNYLNLLCTNLVQNKKEIIEFLNDYKYEIKKETIDYIVANNKFYFDENENKFKKINKVQIIENILKKENRQMEISEIYEKVFFKNEISLRNLESYVDRLENCIRSIYKKARYYNYKLLDKKLLKNLEKTILSLKGFYSTKIIFENNLELMKKLNLEDFYELHNLIKNKIQNKNISLLRMPNILINYDSKEEFIAKLMTKNKINDFNELINTLSTNYGHDKMSLRANLDMQKIQEIKNIKFKNINKNIEINEKEIKIFKNLFTQTFNDTKIIKKEDFFVFLNTNNYKKDFFNNSILKKIGYEISDNFLYIKKIGCNLFLKIRKQIFDTGIYKNEYKDFFTNDLESIFQNDFLRQDIIQINENNIVSYKYFLEKTGIDLNKEIKDINNELSILLKEKKYISFRKIQHFSLFSGFLSNEYCLKFITRKLKQYKYDKLQSELIIRNKKSLRFVDYLVQYIKERKYIKYDELIAKIENEILDKNILNIWKEVGIISRVSSSQELNMFFKDSNTKIIYLKDTYTKLREK